MTLMAAIESRPVPRVRMFIDITLAPVTMRLSMRRARTAALLLVLLLLTTSSPLAFAAGGRALDIALFANPMAQTVNPGENGTYTITVTNTGDDDMIVQLVTQEGQDCQGFTSTIQPITGTIEAGNSETTELSVQVASGAEGDCETIVTGTANSAPGETPSSPAQADVTVTTTAGDGSGNALFGVALTSGSTDRTFEGNNPVRWPVTVENTGQQNETISLEMVDNSTCTSSLSAEVDPTQVVLDSEDTEVVQVEVTVPDGTEAGEHCFTLEDFVAVSGVSKGKGFAGHMKRHGFSGGRRSHGKNSVMRKAGSIGAGSDPSRVWPGTKMAGRMGNENVTVKNLEVTHVEKDKNLVFIKGAVPGANNGIVFISKI